ncbi:MAG: CPBP family intramembrane metalloprotease [Eggerthellaceae bacterium]|nr:CPBP family intramembrane metalloprotease [Eggerthellaceae bacterium]
MKKIRQHQPLVFALVVSIVSALCFWVLPDQVAWAFSGMGVAPEVTYAFAQSLLAAMVTAALYFASGVFGLGARPSALSLRITAAAVLAVALAVGVAKVLVQGGSPTAPLPSVVVFAAMLCATALFEEALFRGLLFEGFAKTFETMGTKNNALLAAAATSSLVFGILHVTSDLGSLFRLTAYVQAVGKIAECTLFGLIMCAVYVKTRSIWLCVVLHACFDLLSEVPIFLVTGVQTSTYLTGSPMDLAIVAVAALVLVLPAKGAYRSLRADASNEKQRS